MRLYPRARDRLRAAAGARFRLGAADPCERATSCSRRSAGLLTFTAVELLGHLLDTRRGARDLARAGGLGAFLYLEVLDASFSFDGVIGAFALTQNLFLIAIGLGIGAMYVRSMTIMLVERKTLAQFRYLEHGAFYSILALSVIMYRPDPRPHLGTGDRHAGGGADRALAVVVDPLQPADRGRTGERCRRHVAGGVRDQPAPSSVATRCSARR